MIAESFSKERTVGNGIVESVLVAVSVDLSVAEISHPTTHRDFPSVLTKARTPFSPGSGRDSKP